MDLYVSERVNGVWGKPTNLGPKINTPKNEVFPYVHADGTLFYSSNGLPGSGGLDIYYLKNSRQEGGLGVPVNLGAPFNSDKDDFGFIVDVDMKNGYFTSSRSGGFGGDDIYAFNVPQSTLFDNLENEYVAEYDPATASRSAGSPSPTGNGATANVNKNASTQTLNIIVIDKQTGRVIQDATASYLNLNDLSMSEIIADNNGKQAQIIKSDGTFALELVESKMRTKQTNALGKAPILAAKTGTYLISAAKKGYSTEQLVVKKGELKNDIVIELKRPSDCITLTGTVKNNVNGGPISYALVSLSNEKGEIKSIPTDQLGAFTICVPCGQAYRAYATKDGKMSTVEAATTKNMDCTEGVERRLQPINLRIDAPVSKDFMINEGNSYQLRNIYYNFNDATIRPDARKDLEALFVVMTKFPDMEIELASHTDARGTDFYNNDLSQRRANSAVQYLVNRGIDAKRILAKGYGESLLRNGCSDGVPCLESLHKLNRRTEVKITKSGSAEGQILTEFFTPESGK